MDINLPNIYSYIDFRKYLEDYRTVRSSFDSSFTHYYICHRLGMKNSRSYFNNIIRGRKNLSAETVRKVIDLLEISSGEADYFRALVNYNQTKQIGEKKYYLDQIIRLNNTPKNIIDEDTYSYFTTWYYPIIRELLETFDFKGDYRELAQKVDPPITLKLAKKSIELLEKLHLIEKNEKGVFKPNGKVISTADNIQNHLVEQYQLLSLERARDRIVNNKNGHKTTTMTIAVSRSGLDYVLAQMAQLRSAIRSMATKDDQPDKKVYEVILHLHSQSK
jgi:uncharacterized protein (TIGR02147 family)